MTYKACSYLYLLISSRRSWEGVNSTMYGRAISYTLEQELWCALIMTRALRCPVPCPCNTKAHALVAYTLSSAQIFTSFEFLRTLLWASHGSWNFCVAECWRLQAFLLEKRICSEIASNFVTNRVSGSAFLKLTEEDLKDLVPIIGVRTEIRDILSQVCQVIFSFQSGS